MTLDELKEMTPFYCRIGAVLVAALCAWKNAPIIALILMVLAVTGSCGI